MTGRLLASTTRAATLFAAATSGARLSIFIYHRVVPSPDPLIPAIPDAEIFERSLCMIRDQFQVLPLDEAIGRLKSATLPPASAAITFDDGYRDNATIALPILRRMGLTATFFIAVGYLNGGRMWNDTVIELIRSYPHEHIDLQKFDLGSHVLGTTTQRMQAMDSIISKLKYAELDRRMKIARALADTAPNALPDDLMMSHDQVRALRACGMSLGAHTINHPILTRVSEAEARYEIAEGKSALEAIVGEKIRLFAYPNGRPEKDYSRLHVDMVRRAGFEGAVSTAPGAAGLAADRYQLPRFTPRHTAPFKFRMQALQNTLMTGFSTA